MDLSPHIFEFDIEYQVRSCIIAEDYKLFVLPQVLSTEI